jgi:hypothetical protein
MFRGIYIYMNTHITYVANLLTNSSTMVNIYQLLIYLTMVNKLVKTFATALQEQEWWCTSMAQQ